MTSSMPGHDDPPRWHRSAGDVEAGNAPGGGRAAGWQLRGLIRRGRRGLKLCSLCKEVAYCSQSCQRAHWKQHKKACKKIQQQRKQSEAATEHAGAAAEVAVASGNDEERIITNGDGIQYVRDSTPTPATFSCLVQ